MNERAVAELLDKQAITEGLYRYCRSMDRMDKDLFRRTFHPDMVAQYTPEHIVRSAEEFIEWMWAHHRRYHNHSHQVSNILIEVDGDEAGSESYVHARLTRRLPNGRFELMTVMGRYIDRWEKRDGNWKIAHRRYLHDIMDMREIDDLIPAGTSFAVRDPDDITRDPSYEVIDTHTPRKAAV
jgi:ketosteroid isomerase-like protein